MKYQGYLQRKGFPETDGPERRINLCSDHTLSVTMDKTLRTYASFTLTDNSPIIPENWYLRIDRDGVPAYEFEFDEIGEDWVEIHP